MAVIITNEVVAAAMPTEEDLKALDAAVQVFISSSNLDARITMLSTARALLNKYNRKRIRRGTYQVIRNLEDRYGVHILAENKIDGALCPGCGEDIYDPLGKVRILSLYPHSRNIYLFTYGCGHCGQIFGKYGEEDD